MRCYVTQEIDKSRRVIEKLLFSEQILSTLETIAEVCVDSLYSGGRILFCGDDTGTAGCQLLASEFNSRIGRIMGSPPSITFRPVADSQAGAQPECERDSRHARGIAGLGRDGDVLIGVSATGDCTAVLESLQLSREMGLATVGLTGCEGVQMIPYCDHLIIIPTHEPERIEEGHIVLGHVLCGLIERAMLADEDMQAAAV